MLLHNALGGVAFLRKGHHYFSITDSIRKTSPENPHSIFQRALLLVGRGCIEKTHRDFFLNSGNVLGGHISVLGDPV